jgi:hypothetical protein
MAIVTIILSMGENTMAQTKSTTVVKNIVLVHGGFVDGSGWEGVYNVLKKDGYTVTIVQNPTISLADDVAFTKRAIAAQNGPVILVGHLSSPKPATIRKWRGWFISLPLRSTKANL